MATLVSKKQAIEIMDSLFNTFHHTLMTITDSGIENSMERQAFWDAANKIDQARFKKDYKETIDNLSATGFRDYYRFVGKFAKELKLAGWKEYNEYDPVVIENLNEELAKKEKTTEKLDLINSFHDEELKSPEFLFDSKMQVLYDIIDDFFVLNDKEEGINKVLRSFSSDDKAAFISKIQNDESLLIKLMDKVDGLEQGAMVSLIGEMFISSGFLTDNKVQHLDNRDEKINASFDKGTIKIKIGKKKTEAKPFDVVSMDYAGSQICIPALMLLSKQEKNLWETLWGALQGEFNEDPTGKEILIDMGLNFIPFVGQACDIRDIAACLKKLVADKRVNEVMIWVTLLLTAIGCVPYAGDVIKAGCKAILKGADDIVLTVLRKLDAEDVYKAFKIFKKKFLSSIDDAIAMVNKWIKEAGNSKYGSKINDVLSSASEKLHQATDFVKKQIDDFEERIFKKGKTDSITEIPGRKEIESVEISPLKHSDSFTDISKQLKKMVPDKYVERATKSINAMAETERKEVMDFIEKLYTDFGPKKTMQDHHWIEKSRIKKKKYQFLKNPPMNINLYDDKKNLSLIVGHNGGHKNTYNSLLDKNLDRITKVLEQECLKRKISLKKLFQDEKTIKWINANVEKVIKKMQNAVKNDHTIMNNVEKMFILD